jgi:hypothetical protein
LTRRPERTALNRRMIVRVRYCGGCNSSYDRVAFLRRVQGAFPSITFLQGGDGADFPPDFTLAVCGCAVKCAAGDEKKEFSFIASSEEDFLPLCRALRCVFDGRGADEHNS